MDKQEVFDFIKAHPRSFLATIEGNVPHVRGIGIPKADENGIVIQTVTMKDVYKQLCHNPNVELCFNDYENNAQLRVSGKAEPLDDPALLKEIMDERSFLKGIADKYGKESIVLYIVRHGRAAKWTMKTNLEAKDTVDL
jgi:pyridoxamine 5'-phosphate oxidase